MLIYDTEDSKVKYFVELDAKPNEPIIVNLAYMQDTQPSNPQNKDIWYDTANNKIYTYKNGAWDNGIDPSVGIFYLYNDQYYLWDGNSLEVTELDIYEKVANKTNEITSQVTDAIKYPTTQAVVDYVTKQSIIRNFTDADITRTTSSNVFSDRSGDNGLAEEILGKQFQTGTTLYGEVRNQGMPTGIGNAEIRVEILETKANGAQVIEFTLFSVDVEPKEWSHIYFSARTEQQNPWVWVPKAVPTDDYTSNATTTVPTSKALSDSLSLKQDKNLSFSNVTASTWIASVTYADYAYECSISCTGVTANSFAQVIFNPTDANSGNYASVCLTGNGTVTIYSKVNTTITIPTIIVMGV